MKLSLKQRFVGFFVIHALMPFALVIGIIRGICLIMSAIFAGIDSICSRVEYWIASKYNRFIKYIE